MTDFDSIVDAVAGYRPGPVRTFADLFCGVGGFHLAAAGQGLECVYACDIDEAARAAYELNFGVRPDDDISRARAAAMPKFDLLCAGFPCQPFSIIGDRLGMSDPRGTLFREIIRLAKAKRPAALVLENVKQLVTIRGGSVFREIMRDIEQLGYFTDYKVLNAMDYGLPQKRERVLVVATQKRFDAFPWPDKKVKMKPLEKILEKEADPQHFVSEKIRKSRQAKHKSEHNPGVWHENKSGNISSYPHSCALRAGASYNYLLVNGERRLTPREMFRLQGFPNSYKLEGNISQLRKQAGNAVPVPLASIAIRGILEVYAKNQVARASETA